MLILLCNKRTYKSDYYFSHTFKDFLCLFMLTHPILTANNEEAVSKEVIESE